MRIALLLGLRAARARGARTRFASFAAAGAVAWLAFAACVAVVGVRSAEAARARALEPVPAASGTGLPYTTMTHEYRGSDVLVVWLGEADGGAPLPPGIGRVPGADEVVVSPALYDRMAGDPTLGAWFAGRTVRRANRAAVGSAGELRAYLPLPPGEVDGAPRVAGFGAARGTGSGAPRPYEAVGLALFLVVPALALLVMASRLGAGVRARRFRAVRLIGMPARAASFAAAVETGAPALLGAAVAAATARLPLPERFTLPVVDRHVFGADARVPALAAVAIVVLVAAACGALGAVTAADGTIARRAGATFHRLRQPSHVLATAYGAGVVGLAVAWVRHDPRDPLLWAAVLVVGVSIPGAAAWLAGTVAAGAARPRLAVPWLLALRRVAADPRTATRAAGAVAVAVFVTGAAQPISQVVAQPNVAWPQQAAARGATTVLGRAETFRPASLSPREPRPAGVTTYVPALGAWRAREPLSERPSAAALVATCADLRALVAQPLPACRDGQRYALVYGDAAPSPGAVRLRGRAGAATRTVDVPAATLRLDATEIPVEATLLLPPGDPAVAAVGQPFVVGGYLRVTATAQAWEAARAWVVAASPAHRLENVFEASVVVDTTARWVLLGIACVAAFATAGSFLAAVDDRSRRRQWFRLRALGMPRGAVVRTELAAASLAALAAVTVATLASAAVAAAYLRVNGESLDDPAPYALAALLAFAAVAAVAVVTAALSQTDRAVALDAS